MGEEQTEGLLDLPIGIQDDFVLGVVSQTHRQGQGR